MRRLAIATFAALVALAAAAPLARAQSTPPTATSTGSGASSSFASGAHQIGEGAQRIGEGIKQGAVEAWDAVKAGASAAAAKLGVGGTPSARPAQSASGGSAR